MPILLLKLTLAPLLIAAATFVQRRWGGSLGGLMVGLPLTSAPVSVFIALERGPAFAARSAIGTLLGTVAMSGFCAVYAISARRLSWLPSAMLASFTSEHLAQRRFSSSSLYSCQASASFLLTQWQGWQAWAPPD